MERIGLAIVAAVMLWLIIPTSWYVWLMLLMLVGIGVWIAEGLNELDDHQRSKWSDYHE